MEYLRQIKSRDPISNTCNTRYHVRQEQLLVITIRQLLLSFLVVVDARRFPSVSPIIVDLRPKVPTAK